MTMVLAMTLVALVACSHEALPGPGGGGGGSGGGDLGGAVDLATPPGDGPRVCSGNGCAACNGAVVCCGNSCCAAGEWCDSVTSTCRCGDRAGCPSGQTCAHGGPIGPGTGSCGSICCGNGVPCPL
jgi:hypothetical protein